MNYIWIHIKYKITRMSHTTCALRAVAAMALVIGSQEAFNAKSIVISALIIFLILWVVCMVVRLSRCDEIEEFAQVKAGDNMYTVHEDLSNPELAAETMDKLNTVATKFIKKMHDKYIAGAGLDTIKPEYQSTVRKGVIDMKKKFKTANMQENLPSRSGGDTSYVINKGEVFAMCLRDPKNGNAIDPKFNTLTFVLLHELSHLFSSTFGHDEIFWNNFRFILQEAIDMKLYELTDYRKNKSPYCGIVVTYSPLFDGRLVNYQLGA